MIDNKCQILGVGHHHRSGQLMVRVKVLSCHRILTTTTTCVWILVADTKDFLGKGVSVSVLITEKFLEMGSESESRHQRLKCLLSAEIATSRAAEPTFSCCHYVVRPRQASAVTIE